MGGVQSPVPPENWREFLDNIEHPDNIKITEANICDSLLLSEEF
jgi:hypothetical protein